LDGGRLGTSAGGRGGSPPKIVPNCAAAGAMKKGKAAAIAVMAMPAARPYRALVLIARRIGNSGNPSRLGLAGSVNTPNAAAEGRAFSPA
jgi:hypothetical protein